MKLHNNGVTLSLPPPLCSTIQLLYISVPKLWLLGEGLLRRIEEEFGGGEPSLGCDLGRSVLSLIGFNKKGTRSLIEFYPGLQFYVGFPYRHYLSLFLSCLAFASPSRDNTTREHGTNELIINHLGCSCCCCGLWNATIIKC